MRKDKKMKRLKKQAKTSLDWLDVEEVHDHHVLLKNNIIVKGVKFEAHDIYLDSRDTQARTIFKLKNLFNKFKGDIFHAYVFSPVNIDSHLNILASQYEVEEDIDIKKMIEDDVDKALLFKTLYRELEFFLMIQGDLSNEFEFKKKYNEFLYEIGVAERPYKELNKLDFENYFAHTFENQLVNDFYFSRGIFGGVNDE